MNPTLSPDDIPEQISDESLIRVSGVDDSVSEGDAGKAPKPGDGAANGPFFSAGDDQLRTWMESGGNVGVVTQDDLVCIDIDDRDEFQDRVDIELTDTFSVRSGGGGLHLFYRCGEWDRGTSLRKDGEEIFSIRVTNSFLVAPPSIHHSTGDPYAVEVDEPIKSINRMPLSRLYDIANPSQHPSQQPKQGGGGSGNGGSSGDGAAARSGCAVPESYPNRSISTDKLKSWVDGNDLPARYSWTHQNKDESAADFILSKCMAESGASPDSIKQTMDKHRVRGTKWHRRGDEYRNYTVQNAIEEAVEDTYVDFGTTVDMGSHDSERRKTEEHDKGRALSGGDMIMSQSDSEYSQLETVTEVESNDPSEGDSVVRAMVGQVIDEQDTYQFAQILGGSIETDEMFGASPNWQTDGNGQNKTRTIGSADPDYIRLVSDALDGLADEIEDAEGEQEAEATADD